MADENFCLTGSAWVTIRAGQQIGVVGNMIDDDTNTSHMVGTGAPPGVPCLIDFDQGVDFDSVSSVTTVQVVHMASGFAATMGSAKLYLYYTGGYNQVLDLGNGVWGKTLFSTVGSWSDVTKVKLVCSGGGVHPFAPSDISGYNYELRVIGPAGAAATDLGVRFTIAGTNIAVGAIALDDTAHKLRYQTTGTTVGIPLVATDDASACGIRFYDGASVKSVPKIDLP